MILLKLPKTLSMEVFYKWNLITVDPDDNKFIDCAVAANARYIVTNDKHSNTLKEVSFSKSSCIRIEEFIKILKAIK